MNNCETCRYVGDRESMCMSETGLPKYVKGQGCPLYAMSGRAFMDRVLHAGRRVAAMQEQSGRYRGAAAVARELLSQAAGDSPAKEDAQSGARALEALAGEIEARAQALREEVARTVEILDRLSDPLHREVLELRYFSDLSWEQIGRRMYYDERQVRRIHLRALACVQREMDLMGLSGMQPSLPGGGGCAQEIPVQ